MKSTEFIMYVGAAMVGVVVLYAFIQWAYEIKKRNRLLDAQVKLLSKIAEKQGVSKEDIEVINRTAETNYKPLS